MKKNRRSAEDGQPKTKLLVIGSTQGVYGGIEAFMIAISAAASLWPDFDVKLCFKLVKGAVFKEELKALAEKKCQHVYYVERGSRELLGLIRWADVLHVQNMPPDVVFPAKLFLKKVFLTVHNRKSSSSGFRNIVWGMTIKLANQRWFNSNFVWNTWESRAKCSNSFCIPTVSSLPGGYCSPGERRGFVFVGRWILNKGIEEIIEAYALNNFNHVECPLVLLGDGPIRNRIIDKINELGLKSVVMPGFVDEKTKEKYLTTSRWLLAPAKTKEDLGLTPIEARNVGVPAIVTNDGGLPEAGGEAALVVEPGNIEDLAEAMLRSFNMSEEEYERRANLAYTSLKSYLKTTDFYRQEYKN